MDEEEEKTPEDKAREIRDRIDSAINDALSDMGEEVLINKWVYTADVIVDGDRFPVVVWDDGMHPVDVESVLNPAVRLAKNMSDSYIVGLYSGALGHIGGIFEEDDEEDYDD